MSQKRDSSPERKQTPANTRIEQLLKWVESYDTRVFCNLTHDLSIERFVTDLSPMDQLCLDKLKHIQLAPRPECAIADCAKLFLLSLPSNFVDPIQISRASHQELAKARFVLKYGIVYVGEFEFWYDDEEVFSSDKTQSWILRAKAFLEAVAIWFLVENYTTQIAYLRGAGTQVPSRIPKAQFELFLKAIPKIEKKSNCIVTKTNEYGNWVVFLIVLN